MAAVSVWVFFFFCMTLFIQTPLFILSGVCVRPRQGSRAERWRVVSPVTRRCITLLGSQPAVKKGEGEERKRVRSLGRSLNLSRRRKKKTKGQIILRYASLAGAEAKYLKRKLQSQRSLLCSAIVEGTEGAAWVDKKGVSFPNITTICVISHFGAKS